MTGQVELISPARRSPVGDPSELFAIYIIVVLNT